MTIWIRLLGLLVAGLLMLSAVRATKTGTVYSGYAIVKRARNPTAFWLGVAVSFMGGLVALVAAIFGT